MAQRVLRRNQNNVEYQANNKVQEKLERGMLYRELVLTLTGQVTLTAGNNIYANILGGDEWALISRIDIRVNGADTVYSISGRALRMMNYYQLGSMPQVSPLLGAGGANPSFRSSLIIPFTMPRAAKPFDTVLNSGKFSSFKIEVTWADHAAIAATATGFTTAPLLEISSLESVGANPAGNAYRVFEIEQDIVASNSKLQIELPTGNMYRGFLINTTEAEVDVDTILNNFKIFSGTTIWTDLKAKAMWELELLRRNIIRPFNGTAYTDLGIGDANSLVGWYFYDHVTDGFMTESIDSAGLTEMKLELDVTKPAGASKIRVFPIEIIPVRGAPVAA